MAYNKNNYENNRLTPKQQKFVEGILQGKSQRQAYLDAYPTAKKWTWNSIDVAANHMMENNKILIRLKTAGYKDEKKIEWTRQKALETINMVMEMNKEDMIRINETYDEELEAKYNELEEWIALLKVPGIDEKGVNKKIDKIKQDIANLKKQRRVNSVNTRGIYDGAKLLNRMFGLDITKVEIKQTDNNDKQEINKLSAEELRQIINISEKENK